MGGLGRGVRGLVVGGRDSLSLGRVAFWLCLGLALAKWSVDRDISASHESVLMWILAYCLGGKVVNTWKGRGGEGRLEGGGGGHEAEAGREGGVIGPC
jgi:hypothetical protein